GTGDDPRGRGDPPQAGGGPLRGPGARRGGGAPRRAAGRPAPPLDLRSLRLGQRDARRGRPRHLRPGRGLPHPQRRRPPRLPAPRHRGRAAAPLPGALRPHHDRGTARRPGRRRLLRALQLPPGRPHPGQTRRPGRRRV
ncbi:MAG: hypothetical protein AVDCRST_MAG88-3788, partial [uncultured Thermomicrobiales bacterium]